MDYSAGKGGGGSAVAAPVAITRRAGASFVLTPSAWTIVVMDHADRDASGMFNAVSGGIVVPASGAYFVSCSVFATCSGGTAIVEIGAAVNTPGNLPVAPAAGFLGGGSAQAPAAFGGILDLAAGDVVFCSVRAISGTSPIADSSSPPTLAVRAL